MNLLVVRQSSSGAEQKKRLRARAECGMLDMENIGFSPVFHFEIQQMNEFLGATVVFILIRSKCTTLKSCKLNRPAGGSTSSQTDPPDSVTIQTAAEGRLEVQRSSPLQDSATVLISGIIMTVKELLISH